MKTLELITVWEKEYVRIQHSPDEKLIWNEWKGVIPSLKLREAITYACNFILEHDVELILADYRNMCSPTFEDQVWIAKNSAEVLQHSKLRRVANLLAQDIFQQIAIESIYETASKVPLPCISKDFVYKNDALDWLLSSD
ncbi:hypothetical protein [uncultured Pontibacter sp.]|uniref:hypothetical protein n=1 Tax=uncultured Pontibacter sp. TaxID=453356 RepID=UPI002615866D|nr:hypothetical protein [uncultured Pontibacter sp.]